MFEPLFKPLENIMPKVVLNNKAEQPSAKPKPEQPDPYKQLIDFLEQNKLFVFVILLLILLIVLVLQQNKQRANPEPEEKYLKLLQNIKKYRSKDYAKLKPKPQPNTETLPEV